MRLNELDLYLGWPPSQPPPPRWWEEQITPSPKGQNLGWGQWRAAEKMIKADVCNPASQDLWILRQLMPERKGEKIRA